MRIVEYAHLTWPDVETLPRSLPLLIPLGESSYDLDAAALRLGVHDLGVLPAVPYGFPFGAEHPLDALRAPPGLLGRVLQGIQRELRAQGFKQVYYLDGQGVRRQIRARGLSFLPTTSRPEAPSFPPWPDDLAERVVVISTGHTEQHGYHLPLATDTIIVEAIAEGLKKAAPETVVCLPVWPYGVSTHTRQYPGTLNLGGRVFEDFFLWIVGRLVRLGARRVYFSNAHGGNHSFLVNVVKWAGERWPEAFTATEWLHTTGPALEQVRTTARGGMGHGGELETSYLLHLRPDLVRMDKATPEVGFITTESYFMDWVESGRLVANPPWTDDTRSGVYGDPTVATAGKGRRWLEAAVREKLTGIDEIIEQQKRRRQRRMEQDRMEKESDLARPPADPEAPKS